MKVSINTAIFLEEVQSGSTQISCLKKLVNKPIDNIEVRGEFFNDETKEQELSEIKDLCLDQNWSLYYSIPEELFTNGKLNSNLLRYIKLAEKFDIKGLKISLGSFDELENETIKELSDMLKNTDVQLTVENQPNQNAVLKSFKSKLSNLVKLIPEIGYTFDSGNWYWIDENPSDAFKNLNQFISVFHLKDIKNKETVMLGNGDTNWKDMIKEINLDIPIFLEYAIEQGKIDEEINKVNFYLK